MLTVWRQKWAEWQYIPAKTNQECEGAGVRGNKIKRSGCGLSGTPTSAMKKATEKERNSQENIISQFIIVPTFYLYSLPTTLILSPRWTYHAIVPMCNL